MVTNREGIAREILGILIVIFEQRSGQFITENHQNPTGKTLLTVTFAPSIESACEIGEEMMKQLEGPRFEVVAM